MVARAAQLTGLDYLAAVTALLQRARLADPDGGLWEAADLQWGWRRDQHGDPANQRFWFDDGGPMAAVVVTDWGDRLGCDLLTVAGGPDPVRELLPVAVDRLAALPDLPVEMAVRDDDAALVAAVGAAGFAPSDERAVGTTMTSSERPAPLSPPAGFTIVSRAELGERPHHMIGRNGAAVAERLEECSLYRPDLDLVVLDDAGTVAAYALFWADPVTGVGLVEPMRTEDAFQGRGLGRVLFAAGLARLADAGCTTLKVTYLADNPAARRLYLGSGFRPQVPSTTFRLRRRRHGTYHPTA